MRIQLGTYIDHTTEELLQEFLREEKLHDPKITKAAIIEAAILEYIKNNETPARP
ncbi:MAG: hypothetical protein M0P69_15085 [Bacteroidales bacterium]|jgi:hypothetical protein|nr:hypothetical protein [Bacteroidales bacterium]